MKKLFPHFPNRTPETLVESLLTVDAMAKERISVLYGFMWSSASSPFTAVKNAWKSSLSIMLTGQQWDSALSLINLSSICARHRLIQSKILFKVHYTNARLA